ncbi:MAG: hypothetical protein NTY17_01405, partial [Planctomycetia bacterium]|nr:hypothetical protein [Planctomycetia bacterium]
MMPALSILPESLVVRQFGVPFAVHDDLDRLPVGKHLDPLRVFVSGVRLQLHEAGFRLRLPGFGFGGALLRFRRPRFRRRRTRFGFLRLALDLRDSRRDVEHFLIAHRHSPFVVALPAARPTRSIPPGTPPTSFSLISLRRLVVSAPCRASVVTAPSVGCRDGFCGGSARCRSATFLPEIPPFIKAIVGCTDTESSRYSLGGVKCESAENVSIITVTDGRKLLNVSYGDECDPVDCIIEAKPLTKAYTAAAVKGRNTVFEVVDGKAMVVGGAGAATAPLIDGKFPRWRDVFGDTSA